MIDLPWCFGRVDTRQVTRLCEAGHRNAKDLRRYPALTRVNLLCSRWKLRMCADKSAYMSRSLDLSIRPIKIRVSILFLSILLHRQEG